MMSKKRKMFSLIAGSILVLFTILIMSPMAVGQTPSPEERARLTEQQMTDDERFGMLMSLMVGDYVCGNDSTLTA